MNNKVLIELIVPDLDQVYNVYIPVNKRIGNIILLMNKALKEFTNGVYIAGESVRLYNRNDGTKYEVNVLVRDTDIRNGTSLILI